MAKSFHYDRDEDARPQSVRQSRRLDRQSRTMRQQRGATEFADARPSLTLMEAQDGTTVRHFLAIRWGR